jgi:hypothetical protein
VSPAAFPINLRPQKTRAIGFSVTYGCANDPLPNTPTVKHGDDRYRAELHGSADADAHDDTRPRDALPSRIDPVNPKIQGNGCGGRKPDRTFGMDLFTDIVVK